MREKYKGNGLGINTKPAPIKVPLRLILKQDSLWLSFHYIRVIFPPEPYLSNCRTMIRVVFVNSLVKKDIDRNWEVSKLHFPVPCKIRFCMTLPPVWVRSWNQFNRNFFIFLSSIACVASSAKALEMYIDRVSRMLTLVSESVLKSDIPWIYYNKFNSSQSLSAAIESSIQFLAFLSNSKFKFITQLRST